MQRFVKFLLYCGYCSVGTVLTLLYIDPAQFGAPATRAVMSASESLYCHKHTHDDVNFQIGGRRRYRA
jgi:hypothetical protein